MSFYSTESFWWKPYYNVTTRSLEVPPGYGYCATKTLTGLPEDTLRIICRSQKLTAVVLPPQVVEVDLGWNHFTTINIPASVKTLDVGGTPLVSLVVPEGVQRLSCDNCESLKTLALPSTLKSLCCLSSRKFGNFISLPPGLVTFYGSSCGFTELPELPITLEKLIVSSNFLRTLPAFPSSLREVDVQSNGLKTLPTLPEGIIKLFFSCNNLTEIPKLPSSVSSLMWKSNLFQDPIPDDWKRICSHIK